MGPHINKEDGNNVNPQVKFEAADHGDSVLAGLKNLREKQQLFDVCLVVQGGRFPAHKVVLASCCDYFRAMFTDGLAESHQEEIHLNGVTLKGMTNLIDFAYTSKVFLDFENIEDVLLSANHIQMIPVLEACTNFLKDNLCIENCCNVANWAEMFSLKKLKTHAFKYMCANFRSLASSQEFRRLPLHHFQTILSCNYPVDCSEVDILSSLIDWLHFNVQERQYAVGHLLQKVNFENISASEFQAMPNVSVLNDVIASNPELKAFITPSKNDMANTKDLLNSRGYEPAIMCVGGFSPHGGMKNDVQFYLAGSSPWKYLTKIPHVQQCNFGQAVLRNELYVVGGCFNDYQQEVVHKYGFKYNPVSQSWSSIGQMLNERCRFYLGSLQGKLYAIGGEPSSINPATQDAGPCEKYDPDTNTWSSIQPIPINSSQHAGVTLGNCIYISGGFQEQEFGVFRHFLKYDAIEDAWTILAPMLEHRADHTMFIYKGEIHVIGGWFEHEPDALFKTMVGSIDRYIEAENRWETVGQVQHPRLYATYTLLDEKLYVIGGWLNGDYHQKAKTIQTYDLVTHEWSNISEAPLEIWEHSCCSMYLPFYKDL